LSAIASNKRSEGRAEAALQRVTVTIDDELMDALERYMLAGGHQNRSEAVRDLVRAGLMKEVDDADDTSRSYVGALVYVYDPAIRQLSRRLLEEHHAHVQMSVSTLHVHLDERSCLEVSILRGRKSKVERFASHLIGERGVRYGQLVTVPVDQEKRRNDTMLVAG
jgi:CopG family transcriptional regulator, nickel-responsive regulator